jgi:phosphatidylglycerophosphate synthase
VTTSPPDVQDADPHAHRALVARLASAQKSNRGAPGYSRWVNRPLGRHIAAVAYRLHRTPNQVTALSAVVTFIGIALLALLRPTWASGIAVCLLLVAGFALDSADGQLARLTRSGSPAGEWLDHVVDCAKTATIHLAVLISWFRFADLSDAMLLVPLAFSVEASVFFFAIVLTEQLRRGAQYAAAPVGPERAPLLRSLVVLPADYGVLCLALALVGVPRVFVPLYTALLVLNVVFLLGALPRWFRDLRSMS